MGFIGDGYQEKLTDYIIRESAARIPSPRIVWEGYCPHCNCYLYSTKDLSHVTDKCYKCGRQLGLRPLDLMDGKDRKDIKGRKGGLVLGLLWNMSSTIVPTSKGFQMFSRTITEKRRDS